MDDFKQYLNEDADEEERAAAERVRKGLQGLHIEQKVAQVAAERQVLRRKKFWSRIVVLATLALIAGAAFLFFRKGETSVFPLQTPSSLPLPAPPKNTADAPADTPPGKKRNQPIAAQRPAPGTDAPRFPAPLVRGENQDDQAWKALLDQIWYTNYPAKGLVVQAPLAGADQLLKARDFNNAYVQFQRLERNHSANDTLRLMKGYCLLEMGEGAEALRYFENLETRQPDWKPDLEWYRGLSLLLTGDRAKALAAFRKIASTPGHPYRQQSKKAVPLLR